MIQQLATVIDVIDNKALLSVHNQGCQSCHLSGACGTGSLGRLLGHRQQPLQVDNLSGLKKGDRVMLELPEKALLYASFSMYLLPLMFMFSFALVAGLLLDASDAINVLAAVIGLFVGLKISASLAAKRFSGFSRPYVYKLGSEFPLSQSI
jgi:sigma-E factor negative regulatory protein RseC